MIMMELEEFVEKIEKFDHVEAANLTKKQRFRYSSQESIKKTSFQVWI